MRPPHLLQTGSNSGKSSTDLFMKSSGTANLTAIEPDASPVMAEDNQEAVKPEEVKPQMSVGKDGAAGMIVNVTESKAADLEAELAQVNAQIPKPSWWMYPIFFIQSFIAAWFGAQMFDQDGDGDFDKDDLVVAMRKKGAKELVMKKKELTEKIRELKQIEAALEKARSKILDEQSENGISKDVVTAEQFQHFLTEAAGLLNLKKHSNDKLLAIQSTLTSGDIKNIKVADIFGALERDVEGERVDDIKHYKRWWIIFVPVQCLVCAGLWLAFMGESDKALNLVQAGLTNIWEDTELMIQKDCQSVFWEIWRWWTYQFTHIGPMHVGMNCFLTLGFGLPLEGQNGPHRVIMVFNLGVFGGACASWLTHPLDVTVGMSGGVYSLMGWFFGELIMNWKQKKVSVVPSHHDCFPDGC